MNLIVFNHDMAPFGVRMVWKGQRYGRSGALIHRGDDPLVEFWDLHRVSEPTLEFADQAGAQFIQRYNASVVRETRDGCGLDLYVSEPRWKLDGAAMTMVRRFLKGAFDAAANGTRLPQ